MVSYNICQSKFKKEWQDTINIFAACKDVPSSIPKKEDGHGSHKHGNLCPEEVPSSGPRLGNAFSVVVIAILYHWIHVYNSMVTDCTY